MTLPDLSRCQCRLSTERPGPERQRHISISEDRTEYGENLDLAQSMLLLLAEDTVEKIERTRRRSRHLDKSKIRTRLKDCIEHSAPIVRETLRHKFEDDIQPETDEPEVADPTQAFPTEARIKQKAKEARIKEETGEKTSATETKENNPSRKR